MDFKMIGTVQAKINNSTASPIKKGQIIFTEDTRRLFWDCSNIDRVEITDFFILNTDTERATISPVPDKLYFVKDTRHLWVYSNGEWSDMSVPSTGGGTNIRISTSQPADQNTNDFWLEKLS